MNKRLYLFVWRINFVVEVYQVIYKLEDKHQNAYYDDYGGPSSSIFEVKAVVSGLGWAVILLSQEWKRNFTDVIKMNLTNDQDQKFVATRDMDNEQRRKYVGLILTQAFDRDLTWW